MLFIIISTESYAQRYVRGSITKADGSETTGFVRKTDREDRARFVTFKPRRAAIQITYMPGEITGYTMRRTSYEYVAMPVSLTFTRRVFAINLVEGSNQLYRYRNQEGDWMYIIDPANEDPTELRPDTYQDQLRAIMADCPDSYKRVENARYRCGSLKRLVKRYNRCFQ